jgi:hypothetical protein
MDPSRSRLFSSREGKKSKEETEKGTGQVKAGFASYQPEITRYTGSALSRRPETRTYQKIHFTDGEKPRGGFFFSQLPASGPADGGKTRAPAISMLQYTMWQKSTKRGSNYAID